MDRLRQSYLPKQLYFSFALSFIIPCIQSLSTSPVTSKPDVGWANKEKGKARHDDTKCWECWRRKSLRAGQRAPEEQVTVQNSKRASQQPAHLDIPKAGESRGGEKIWGQCWSVFFKLQPQFLKQTHCFVSLGIPGH